MPLVDLKTYTDGAYSEIHIERIPVEVLGLINNLIKRGIPPKRNPSKFENPFRFGDEKRLIDISCFPGDFQWYKCDIRGLVAGKEWHGI